MAGIKLTPGARLLLDGGTWTIREVNNDAQYCVLDDGAGTRSLRSFAEVITSTTLAGINEHLSNDHLWRRIPKDRREREQRRLDHLREAETGYRSGDHRDPLPGEPRPQYDPSKTTITQRRITKATELAEEGFRTAGLSMSYKTLERKGAEYRKRGTSSLLDRRLVPRRRGHNLSEEVEKACLSIDGRLRASSNVTNTTRYRLIRALLSTSGYTGPVPSQSTIDRWFESMTDGTSVRGKAKYRDRGAAPSGGYRPPVPQYR